jgi:hypothetical protein
MVIVVESSYADPLFKVVTRRYDAQKYLAQPRHFQFPTSDVREGGFTLTY